MKEIIISEQTKTQKFIKSRIKDLNLWTVKSALIADEKSDVTKYFRFKINKNN